MVRSKFVPGSGLFRSPLSIYIKKALSAPGKEDSLPCHLVLHSPDAPLLSFSFCPHLGAHLSLSQNSASLLGVSTVEREWRRGIIAVKPNPPICSPYVLHVSLGRRLKSVSPPPKVPCRATLYVVRLHILVMRMEMAGRIFSCLCVFRWPEVQQ